MVSYTEAPLAEWTVCGRGGNAGGWRRWLGMCLDIPFGQVPTQSSLGPALQLAQHLSKSTLATLWAESLSSAWLHLALSDPSLTPRIYSRPSRLRCCRVRCGEVRRYTYADTEAQRYRGIFLIIDLAPSRAGKTGPFANQQGLPRARIPVDDGLRDPLVPIWHGINKTTCALQTHLSLFLSL